MILDVAEADLEASVASLGHFHPTTTHFRANRDEATKAWDRLRVEFGLKTLEAALTQPPLAYLEVRVGTPARLTYFIPIDGQTYHAERVAGTPLAPTQWRLHRIKPALEYGPYYVCRLQQGLTQCDCAEWTYRVAEPMQAQAPPQPCKHVSALWTLGWL
jgi:hypothetical protein